MPTEREELERLFVGLQRWPWERTSAPSEHYNCIAHAIGDSGRWWWPGGVTDPAPGEDYWPEAGASDEQLQDFLTPFEQLGFERCAAGELDAGLDKVAFYLDDTGLVQHVARQLPDGRWSSKLGQMADIAHPLEALEGVEYGWARIFLQRSRSTTP
jgi:hypothetical protein